ncbi:MAG: hypothetical protein JWR18_2694 [Segetibacter sp.]|nr:hypothetical protein [Segetibacter sp.]
MRATIFLQARFLHARCFRYQRLYKPQRGTIHADIDKAVKAGIFKPSTENVVKKCIKG